MKKVFISHNHQDKEFVRRLASEIKKCGIDSWIDESEMHYGESLIHKISEAIEEIECVLAIISTNSIFSSWVRQELDWALTKEIKNKKVVVIPIVIDSCDIPFFLSNKYYADFTDEKNFEKTLKKLVDSILFYQGSYNFIFDRDEIFGRSVSIKKDPTLLPFFIVSGVIILSIFALIASTYFFEGIPAFANSHFLKKNIQTFWGLVIALMFGELIRLFLLKYQIHIDPVFAYESGLIRITSLVFSSYRKLVQKYWSKLIIKVVVFFELVIIVGIFILIDYAIQIIRLAF